MSRNACLGRWIFAYYDNFVFYYYMLHGYHICMCINKDHSVKMIERDICDETYVDFERYMINIISKCYIGLKH